MHSLVFKIVLTAVFSVLLFSSCNNKQQTDESVIPPKTTQLILVVTDSDSAFNGKLRRFERASINAPWQSVDSEMAIVVGKNGLGWGVGLHPKNTVEGLPNKKEGDGKSPAGIFKLSAVFGFPPAEEMVFLNFPYLHVNEALECVDDANSRFYNQVVENTAVDSIDWQSSEKMIKVDPQYRLGVTVDHNFPNPQPGGGSCIFLHIWKNNETPTIGCTAMAATDMETIAKWLDESKHPVLVQLTADLYQQFKTEWQLP